MKYIIFSIKYHIFMTIRKILKPKRREYFLYIFGQYPDNFKAGISPVLDSKSLLKYSITNSCLIVRFDSTQKIQDIKNTFNKLYSGHIEAYFLFEVNRNHNVMGLNDLLNKHLYDENYEKVTLNESLDRIQNFINLLNTIRNNINLYINAIENLDGESESIININGDGTSPKKIDMEDINPILEKIKNQGMESLTETEKIILNKYATND